MSPAPSDDDRREERPDDHGDRDSTADPETDRDREPRRFGEADENESSDERPSAGDVLSSLLNALESLDRISGSGSRRRGNRRLEYDVSIGSGLDSLDPDAARGSESDRSADPDSPGRRSDPSVERSSRRRRRRSASSYRTAVRAEDDRLLVTADVAGADPDAVTVGFDDGDLVIAVERDEVERVAVPWSQPAANAHVKNGVLTVTVTHGGEASE